MKFLYPVLLALGLASPTASHAEQFIIDPLNSYIEVDIPFWVQGGAWGFVGPNELIPTASGGVIETAGEMVVLGYDWHVETQTMRYPLSGRFEWVDSGLIQDSFVGVD